MVHFLTTSFFTTYNQPPDSTLEEVVILKFFLNLKIEEYVLHLRSCLQSAR